MDFSFDLVTAGVSGLSNISFFGLFLNPATGGRFNVSFERRQQVFPGDDISALPKGIYFLRLEADGEVLTRWVVAP